MGYAIAAIAGVVLLSMKELSAAKPRGKIMGIYFTMIGISLLVSILISINKTPMSPNTVIKNIIRFFGVGE